MKILFLALFVLLFTPGYGQNYYSFSQNNTGIIADKPDFLNIDSILISLNYKIVDFQYSTIDNYLANFDMDVLGERHKSSFIKDINNTFIRDVGILMPSGDTIKLITRAFVYKDKEEADRVFKYLDRKIVSGIIVPNYRIVYQQGNEIYFISLKAYHKVKKEFPKIIYPIFNALKQQNKNLPLLLFKHDLRIERIGNSPL